MKLCKLTIKFLIVSKLLSLNDYVFGSIKNGLDISNRP